MKLENEVNNNIKIDNEQNNFLNTVIGKTINSAIDIGLKTILPDLIEEQIIDIKNSLLKNGLKAGIKSTIDNTIDFAKSIQGIITGEFENVNQVQTAIGNGGIIDSISDLLDIVSNKAYEKGYINKNINKIIKNGKDILLDNISNNIKSELNYQTNSIDKLNEYINDWKTYYNNKNFNEMEKVFNKIQIVIPQVIPFEKIIKETREIENIHMLIKNNGNKFDISDLEKEVIKKLY